MKKTAQLLAGIVTLSTVLMAGNALAQMANPTNPNDVFQPQSNDPFSRTNDGSSNPLNLIHQLRQGATMNDADFNLQQRRNLNSASQKFRQLQLERIEMMNQTPASPAPVTPTTPTAP